MWGLRASLVQPAVGPWEGSCYLHVLRKSVSFLMMKVTCPCGDMPGGGNLCNPASRQHLRALSCLFLVYCVCCFLKICTLARSMAFGLRFSAPP